MKLLSLGVDHRSAPTAIRESLALEGATRARGLELLKQAYPGIEFVILSTCNRVELYAAGVGEARDEVPAVEDLVDWLAGFRGVDAALLSSHVVAHHDEAVIGHLFRVASSLESLVLGEGQILGQVREAYKAADTCSAVGPVLHEAFQQAIRVGKKVREKTGMDRGKLSVASVAVDLAREVFDSFSDKTVLVIGAGKMAEVTLQHLSALRPGRIVVSNRNLDRARETATRYGGEAAPFEQLGQVLIAADLVVSTTASEDPIVTYEMYERVQRARRNRLSLILDIAVPRDFDDRIGGLSQVLLYNVDDLKAQVEQNLEGRRKGIDPAQAIIEFETAACLAALKHRRHAGAVLKELGAHADQVRCRELDKLYLLCPELSEAQRAAVAQFALRLQNQFLHHPRAALRSATTADPQQPEGAPAQEPTLVETVRHLFGLGHSEG